MGATIDEAMKQVVEIPDKLALMALLKERFDYWHPTEANVTIKRYGFDARIGWHTCLISIDGKAALFSDGDLPDFALPIGGPR